MATETIQLVIPVASDVVGQHGRAAIEQAMAEGALDGLSKVIDNA